MLPINVWKIHWLVSSKVRKIWEAQKNLRNLPHALYIYLLNVQSMRKTFSDFVCFSESPNFNRNHCVMWYLSAYFISIRNGLKKLQIFYTFELELNAISIWTFISWRSVVWTEAPKNYWQSLTTWWSMTHFFFSIIEAMTRIDY